MFPRKVTHAASVPIECIVDFPAIRVRLSAPVVVVILVIAVAVATPGSEWFEFLASVVTSLAGLAAGLGRPRRRAGRIGRKARGKA